MHPIIRQFLNFLETNKTVCNKDQLIQMCTNEFALVQDRKVYHCDYFAVRFSYSKNGSFSNTVLSLSALEKYDRIPFFTVLVKGNGDNVVYLANTTFVTKISHSSQMLTMTNIKGSFNGSDIMKHPYDMDNEPANFELLFALHEGLSWEDNLRRLVDASSRIKPNSTRFVPTEQEKANILDSVKRARCFVSSPDYSELLEDLNQRCENARDAIMVAAHVENVNIRGRLIEVLITADKEERKRLLLDIANIERALPLYDTRNELGDYVRQFPEADTYTDIKTKVVYLKSNPKMYNIDKFLKCMAENKSVFMFFFVGVDENGVQHTALCSVYHKELLNSMHLQSHWAGRSTRGVAQASGSSINTILNGAENCSIDENMATDYLNKLLNR